jgi:hypothetical protein
MEKISLKVSMGLLRQKEVVYFSLLIRKVIVCSSGFAVICMRKRAVNSDKAKVVYGRRFFTSFL